MPYKSKAQQKKFHADPKLKKLAPHWDEETKKTKKGFKGLPNKVRKKKAKKRNARKK